jgi:hypothetical protein
MKSNMIVKEITFADLAKVLDFESFSEEADLNIEDLDLFVETPNGFSKISEFYVKPRTIGYQLGDLIASGDHKTLVNGVWTMLKDNPSAICLNREIDVVDVCVPDGNSYVANGHVNHNTTPGGWN